MSNQYPKMLYLGGLTSHAIANNEDEADALKERGYVEHEEAVKLEPKITKQVSNDTSDQLGEAYEHIERQEEAVALKDEEILKLKGELEKCNEWCNEVTAQNELHRKTIRELRAKLEVYETAQDKNDDNEVSYDEMTIPQLSELLDQRNIEHNKRDGKDALVQQAKDSE